MNEKTVLKRSLYVFLIGLVIFGIVGIILKNISYLTGFVLGYVINLLVFMIIIKMSEGILKFSTAIPIVAFMFILKLILYAIGFFIAIKTPYIHILGVFIGYMVTKVTIYMEGYTHKGGEVDG